MILGTLLPLLLERQAATPAGGLIFGGLCVCSIGLVFSVRSLSTRDMDERNQNFNPVTVTNHMANNEGDKVPQDDILKVANDNSQRGMATSEITDPNHTLASTTDDTATPHNYSTIYKVSVCVVTGIFASSLQFAFVFGNPLIDLAKSPNGPGTTPPSGSASIIWLFAIPVSVPISIIYGLCNSPKDVAFSTLWRSPWYRYLNVLLTTSIPWVSHIHLYGYSTSLMPDEIAASIAWPVLMMVTVTVGIFWSIVLGEWNRASKSALLQLYVGITIVTAGVIVLMSSAALS